ncbi:hypothetical protein BDN72DRAFT_869202 [Pluteus cervinus]|uniref:Uncharacterized protein n=1 Tax=Pluteus cervinus TaxID=181527 RepID=A0ACD3B4Y4_9AGAR|nr:hypothetical protein BDN72DRAFT_869202 [Pluteus cervinus]
MSDDCDEYPPAPATQSLVDTIIKSYCADIHPDNIAESGCAVCGQLKPTKDMTPITKIKGLFRILDNGGLTKKERKDDSQPLESLEGPVVDPECSGVCAECRVSLRKSNIPSHALAKNLWIGKVPTELAELNFMERLLVSRVRINSAIVKVSSGFYKMRAHIIAFENPIAKIYDKLPPPRADLDEVLAILFTGPRPPTAEDYARLPFFIRRRKLNHADYSNVDIDDEALAGYSEHEPPVAIQYKKIDTNKTTESMSQGVDEGPCTFAERDNMSAEALKMAALQHLNKGGKMLLVQHGSESIPTYDLKNLYAQMFPCVGCSTLSVKAHIKYLLMYHDKRFQKDPHFPFVAFSHQQVKSASLGGWLLGSVNNVNEISNRILALDMTTVKNLANRLANGEPPTDRTPQEKECFQVIKDLDHINGHKYMRNEIWSLIAAKGAPSWYITLSPTDVHHPIAFYYASKEEKMTIPVLKHHTGVSMEKQLLIMARWNSKAA